MTDMECLTRTYYKNGLHEMAYRKPSHNPPITKKIIISQLFDCFIL